MQHVWWSKIACQLEGKQDSIAQEKIAAFQTERNHGCSATFQRSRIQLQVTSQLPTEKENQKLCTKFYLQLTTSRCEIRFNNNNKNVQSGISSDHLTNWAQIKHTTWLDLIYSSLTKWDLYWRNRNQKKKANKKARWIWSTKQKPWNY